MSSTWSMFRLVECGPIVSVTMCLWLFSVVNRLARPFSTSTHSCVRWATFVSDGLNMTVSDTSTD